MAPRKPKADIPFAAKSDLGPDEDYEDIVLPMMRRKVRVRHLDTGQIARLGFLPDLLGYFQMVEMFQDAKKVDEVDLSKLAFEEKNYQAALAHIAVADPDAGESDIECEACGFEHPPSLWSFRQTRKIHTTDVDQIAKVACRAQLMGFLRPLSKAATPSASPQPADSGELTPAPS